MELQEPYIHVPYIWTEKFDTKIQPNVGRYGRYTSPNGSYGKMFGRMCVCGTVLVGEVDVDFFVFEMDI